jgi:hypothetical protein
MSDRSGEQASADEIERKLRELNEEISGAGKVRASGAPVNPYSMNNPPVTGTCQPTTGT